MSENQSASGTEKYVSKVLTLFRELGSVGGKIDFEQSFKVVHGDILENRFLLGLDRRQADRRRDERIALVCEHKGMPHNLLAIFQKDLTTANHVYFGVEKNEQTLLFKTYLEFRDQIEQGVGNTDVAGRSFPLFAGFKWEAFSPDRQAVTQYAWYPSRSISEVLERLQMALDPSRHAGLFEIAQGIIKRAADTIDASDIQFLEVTEEGNPRRSFDINIYKSGLRLEELFPQLLRAMRHYSIPSDRFEALYQKIKGERFGHLAGGVDREDKDFMTAYYGVKPIQSGQLASATVVPVDRAT